MGIRYYRLLDTENYGTIVKTEGQRHYKLEDGKWIRSGIMLHYFWPESDRFELYEELTAEEIELFAS